MICKKQSQSTSSLGIGGKKKYKYLAHSQRTKFLIKDLPEKGSGSFVAFCVFLLFDCFDRSGNVFDGIETNIHNVCKDDDSKNEMDRIV
jgi:hypothetical protein